MGDIFAIGMCDCGCGGCSCTITGTILGCHILNLGNVTVEAHDSTSGGTLLGSTTSASNGTYTLTATGATTGNPIVIVFILSPRFNQTTSTLTYTAGVPNSSHWSCTQTTSGVSVSMTVATGYHCVYGCALPFNDTLYVSETLSGTNSVAWTSDNGAVAIWLSCGSISMNSYNCQTCVATGASIPLLVTLSFVKATGKANISVAVPSCGSGRCAAGLSPASHDIGGTLLTCATPGGLTCGLSVVGATLNCTAPFNASGTGSGQCGFGNTASFSE